MGAEKSILEQKGYALQKETEYTRMSIPNNSFVATKGAETFLIRDIQSQRVSRKKKKFLVELIFTYEQ